RWPRDWSSDVCSSDLTARTARIAKREGRNGKEAGNCHCSRDRRGYSIRTVKYAEADAEGFAKALEIGGSLDKVERWKMGSSLMRRSKAVTCATGCAALPGGGSHSGAGQGQFHSPRSPLSSSAIAETRRQVGCVLSQRKQNLSRSTIAMGT